MHARRLSDATVRTYVVVFQTGDEAMSGLQAFAAEHDLTAASFTGIGACQEADLGAYRAETKSYTSIPVRQQMEIASFTGDLTRDPSGDGYTVHAHAVLTDPDDGAAKGGHVMRLVIRPTLEVFVTASTPILSRRNDEASGLALITPGG